jgi:membrane-associated protein
MSLDAITPLIIEYRYWILLPLAFLEGPLVSLSAGLLASLGYFNPWVVLAVLICKDVSVDAVCYALGRWGNHDNLVHRYAKKIGITEEHWGAVERLWEHHPWRTMFLSKIAYGLSLPFLVSAGLSRISYKKFWFYALQISLIQYGGLLALGYFFGNSISVIKDTVDIVSIAVGVLSVGAVVYYAFSLRMRKKLMVDEKKEEI